MTIGEFSPPRRYHRPGMKYAIIIETGERNLSAYVPDVPGCVATARTVEELSQRMQEALELHFQGMLLRGETIPPSKSIAATVEVDMARVTANAAARKTRKAPK